MILANKNSVKLIHRNIPIY